MLPLDLSLCVTSEFDPFVLLVPEPIRAGGIGGTWPSATGMSTLQSQKYKQAYTVLDSFWHPNWLV